MKRLLLALICLLYPWSAFAQEACAGGTCVADADLKTFLAIAAEKQCLQKTTPTLKLDPVTIVVDKEGRVYYSGAEPQPYTVKITWCGYELSATGKVTTTVAQKVEPNWGFRFRPKFAGSFLFVDAFDSSRAVDAFDIGLLWDLFYYKALNFNVATGFRSAGAGVGVDLFRNVTLYGGWAFSWWTLKNNPSIGLGFALW